MQPGQRPLVENVFHMVPQPSKNGSGVPTQSQYQRLDADGRQVHRGHRIPSNVSMCSRLSTLTVIWPDTPSSLSKRNDIEMSVLFDPCAGQLEIPVPRSANGLPLADQHGQRFRAWLGIDASFATLSAMLPGTLCLYG